MQYIKINLTKLYGVKKMKKISKILLVLIVINVLSVIFNFSISTVSAHRLTSWSNLYSADNAGGAYQFGIGDYYHVNGRNANYFWDNSTAKSYFSSALAGGVNMWDGMITVTETNQSSAHFKITYNPNVIVNAAADVVCYYTSNGHYHYGPDEIITTMHIYNILNYSQSDKIKVLGHELGHLWGIKDLYNIGKNDLNSIYSQPYSFDKATRHDKNAMYICLNNPWFDTGNSNARWKRQISPGVWAKNKWLNLGSNAYYFNSSGIMEHQISGNIPLTSVNIANGVYEIQGKTSGKLIHTSSTGGNAILYNSGTSNNQRFNFVRQSDGTYSITALSTGKVLEDPGLSYAQGTQMKFYSWNGGNNQKWYIADCGNGLVKFINKHSGLALDIFEDQTDNNTPIVQWRDKGSNAQRFILLTVD